MITENRSYPKFSTIKTLKLPFCWLFESFSIWVHIEASIGPTFPMVQKGGSQSFQNCRETTVLVYCARFCVSRSWTAQNSKVFINRSKGVLKLSFVQSSETVIVHASLPCHLLIRDWLLNWKMTDYNFCVAVSRFQSNRKKSLILVYHFFSYYSSTLHHFLNGENGINSSVEARLTWSSLINERSTDFSGRTIKAKKR